MWTYMLSASQGLRGGCHACGSNYVYLHALSSSVSACSVCSHGNQPDKCTHYLFHGRHAYTQTGASPLPGRLTAHGGFQLLWGPRLCEWAHRACHGVQRRCIQQRRSTEHRRSVVKHLEEGPSKAACCWGVMYEMADDLGVWRTVWVMPPCGHAPQVGHLDE